MRTCGDCTVCCYIGAVPAINKAAHLQCPYLNKRCSIFKSNKRPEVCSSFECLWLRGMGLPEDRPDINGIMCSANKMNGGDWVFVIETQPNAVLATGRNMVKRLTTLASTPIIIVDYDAVPPEDKGNRVVIKDKLKSRSKYIAGEFIKYLDVEETMGIYKLVVR